MAAHMVSIARGEYHEDYTYAQPYVGWLGRVICVGGWVGWGGVG